MALKINFTLVNLNVVGVLCCVTWRFKIYSCYCFCYRRFVDPAIVSDKWFFFFFWAESSWRSQRANNLNTILAIVVGCRLKSIKISSTINSEYEFEIGSYDCNAIFVFKIRNFSIKTEKTELRW